VKGNLSLTYGIGKCAKTKEYQFYNSQFLEPLKKQISISIPLITSATLHSSFEHKKQPLFSIYVGKELNTHCSNNYYLDKYDLDEEELERYRDAGYERVCLLNYKKYDVVLIGLNKEDKVVSDYYALRRDLLKLNQVQKDFISNY